MQHVRRHHAARKRHAFQQAVQRQAQRGANPRDVAHRLVRMIVFVRVIMAVLAGRLGRLMMVETREALHEEHHQEPRGGGQHDRVERIVVDAARLAARHHRMRQHVEHGHAQHHATHERQGQLQATVGPPHQRGQQAPRHTCGRHDAAPDPDPLGVHHFEGSGVDGLPPSVHSRPQSAGAKGFRWVCRRWHAPRCRATLFASHGVVAQLGERLNRIQEVVSSILIHSTLSAWPAVRRASAFLMSAPLKRRLRSSRHPGPTCQRRRRAHASPAMPSSVTAPGAGMNMNVSPTPYATVLTDAIGLFAASASRLA